MHFCQYFTRHSARCDISYRQSAVITILPRIWYGGTELTLQVNAPINNVSVTQSAHLLLCSALAICITEILGHPGVGRLRLINATTFEFGDRHVPDFARTAIAVGKFHDQLHALHEKHSTMSCSPSKRDRRATDKHFASNGRINRICISCETFYS